MMDKGRHLLFSKWLLENQFIINAYTINDQTMLDNMLELGVTGIFTDNHKFYSTYVMIRNFVIISC